MNDEAEQPLSLRERTMQYAVRVIRLCASLPGSGPAGVIRNQLVRSGTSIGAHWREAHRSRSTAEFVSKLETALQELDESQYWMELLVQSDLLPQSRLADLIKETDELIAIMVASVKTAKATRTK